MDSARTRGIICMWRSTAGACPSDHCNAHGGQDIYVALREAHRSARTAVASPRAAAPQPPPRATPQSLTARARGRPAAPRTPRPGARPQQEAQVGVLQAGGWSPCTRACSSRTLPATLPLIELGTVRPALRGASPPFFTPSRRPSLPPAASSSFLQAPTVEFFT